jgi:tRNA pseudouridine55 synthase
MHGLLIVDKLQGITSRDAVNAIARLVKPAKVGHAGTLDPLATGVLVVCVGHATRLTEYVQRRESQYVGRFLLGRRSPTEDIEGEVEELLDAPVPTREQLDAAAATFLGTTLQRPPQYSALKVGGQRAYDLARRGETVELAAREITLTRIRVTEYRYPEFTLDVQCSGGTYIRSLGRDLAERVGSAAVMAALRRTAIGDLALDGADAVVDLARLDLPLLRASLINMARAVATLPQLVVTDAELAELSHGRFITAQGAPTRAPQSADLPRDSPLEIAALDAAGELRAILTPHGVNQWRPARVFKY